MYRPATLMSECWVRVWHLEELKRGIWSTMALASRGQ